ncbi:MAG: hypothetical protein GC165_07595 [Armatimonadetes bacterium]|nr:hypothetical protein [Armatimonadota bacterium]
MFLNVLLLSIPPPVSQGAVTPVGFSSSDLLSEYYTWRDDQVTLHAKSSKTFKLDSPVDHAVLSSQGLCLVASQGFHYEISAKTGQIRNLKSLVYSVNGELQKKVGANTRYGMSWISPDEKYAIFFKLPTIRLGTPPVKESAHESPDEVFWSFEDNRVHFGIPQRNNSKARPYYFPENASIGFLNQDYLLETYNVKDGRRVKSAKFQFVSSPILTQGGDVMFGVNASRRLLRMDSTASMLKTKVGPQVKTFCYAPSKSLIVALKAEGLLFLDAKALTQRKVIKMPISGTEQIGATKDGVLIVTPSGERIVPWPKGY